MDPAPGGSAPRSAQAAKGLRGIIAASSRICLVDGVAGRMLYEGYDIHDLAAHASFEEVAYLLWHGDLPTRTQLAELDDDLRAARALSEPIMVVLQSFPKDALPMDVLRTAASALGIADPDSKGNSQPANARKAVRLTAQLATVVAAIDRIRSGKPPVAPDPGLGHAANFLYMLRGEPPAESATRAMDVALVLHADHELNASTFAARVTAATRADMHSAITSAIGTLKGPLHGGANEAVMRMLLRIGEVSNAVPAVKQMLAEKQRIMGFGHAVYKTEDPRATHLREMSEELCRQTGQLKWFEMSREIETFMLAEKGLHCNVDFYSATCYYALGIPIDLFTPVFAVSRVSGWTAHVLEQLADNRLIRPRAEYVGPRDRVYVPLERRG